MYPKKTLSAASLLSKCERKRRRSLEARGCTKSESESLKERADYITTDVDKDGIYNACVALGLFTDDK